MADIEVSCDLQNTKNINASFSDVIDINLQKEIKMGIDLNAPLYIGADTNLQKQVTQNTADIADLKQDVSDIESDIGSLDNLTTTDKSSLVGAINEVNTLLPPTSQRDYIDNSKAIYSGEVSENALILPQIKEMAHSTFDRSKFTVVGSPNITDDGIASGFSSGSVLKTSYTIPFTTAKSLIIKFRTHINNTGNVQVLFNNSDEASIFWGGINASGQPAVLLGLDAGQTVIPNNIYDFILTVDLVNKTRVVGFKLATDTNYTYTTSKDCTANIPTVDSILVLGAHGVYSTYSYSGTIDLKQFSITVDGVEVFSGNKTGIDTIKPDDYIVGSDANISDDGIIIGSHGESTGVYKGNVFGSFSNAKIYLKIKKLANPTDLSGNNAIFHYANSMNIFTSFSSNGTALLAQNGADYPTLYNVEEIEIGDVIDIEIDVDNINKTVTYNYSKNGTLHAPLTRNYTTTLTTLSFASYDTSLSLNNTAWEVDLNSIKYIVDSNLVYQPCLKIPYTESKTGSKIVDSIYRDRVNDMAEQLGYANYYTLDEDNGNFTLPQVELYGLIGQRTLRDSYRNGINYWELYSNRDLEQGGSCTSGVEITFPRPFADTNYVLSVPYSAKSETAFTPAQTGDWIAKGKGLL